MAFEWPWAMILMPLGCAAAIWIDRRYRGRSNSLKRRVTLGARLMLIVLMAFAIASPSLLVQTNKTARWVLLDVSDSAEAASEGMREALKTALADLPRGEEAGVIVFGENAMVETPLSAEPTFTGVHAAVSGDGSDLNGALLLASALLPTDGAGGITVISDGRADADASVISMLAARGVKADVLAFDAGETIDAQLSALTAPAEAYEGQSLTVEALIDANAAMSGTLVLYQNGQPTMTRAVKLSKGENRFVFTDTARQTGVMTYEARLIAPEDRESRNNAAAAYVRVSGAPNVLLVSFGASVQSLFEAAGFNVTSVRPEELWDSADGYLAYDAVILNNIDYDSMGETHWKALYDAVNTLGRGLCVLGGDSSYALGGYRGSLLEELLPVTIDVRDKLRMPALSLVIAIDKSGSMTSGQYGTSRIEVAKEAAMRAVEVLSERDNVGVIGFDDTAKWVVPFQSVRDLSAIQSQIGTIRADGGTAFYSAMSEAYLALVGANTPQKHVIFLSDGQPGDTGYQDIAFAMSKAGITLTTVAVGSDADTRLMSLLSTLGGGRSYAVGEFDNIPKVFTKETMLVGGNYVQNRVFVPVIAENAEMTAFDGFPTLRGYLTTVEKPTATLSLMSDTDDPILAWWHAGAGKVVAWTSDAEGAWSENFLRWEDAPSFFGGLVAKTLPGGDREGTLSARADGNELHIAYETAEIAQEDAKRITEATVILPDGTQSAVTLSETEPGLYEGVTEARVQGAYALRVTQTDGEGMALRSQEGGAVVGYAREYDLRTSAGEGLVRLAQSTGGRVLDGTDGFWDTAIGGVMTRRRLQPLLILICLALFLCDIALRKLPWEDALFRVLNRTRTKPDEAPRTNAKPDETARPQRPDKRKTKAEEGKARQAEAANTADALLSAKRAKNIK